MEGGREARRTNYFIYPSIPFPFPFSFKASFVRAHDPVHATRRDDLTSTDEQEVR